MTHFTFDASAEACRVAQLPLAGRFLGGVVGQAADEERRTQPQVLVFALVDHGTSVAHVHAQGKVLLLGQQLHRVVAAIRNRFVTVGPFQGNLIVAETIEFIADERIPEHVGDGVIAHVVTDADASAEQFNGDVLRLAVVDQDAVFLISGEDHRDVSLRLGFQRRHFNERTVLDKTDARQKFTALAWRVQINQNGTQSVCGRLNHFLRGKKMCRFFKPTPKPTPPVRAAYLCIRVRTCKYNPSALAVGSRFRSDNRAAGTERSVGIASSPAGRKKQIYYFSTFFLHKVQTLTMGETSQNLPENSSVHLHVYSLIPSAQVPPF